MKLLNEGKAQWGIVAPITLKGLTQALAFYWGWGIPAGWQILVVLKAIDNQQLVDHFNLWPLASYKAATLWQGETVCISREEGTRILEKHRPILSCQTWSSGASTAFLLSAWSSFYHSVTERRHSGLVMAKLNWDRFSKQSSPNRSSSSSISTSCAWKNALLAGLTNQYPPKWMWRGICSLTLIATNNF